MDEVEDAKRCTAIKRDGERCGARKMSDAPTCALHSPRGAEIRSKAVQAATEARQDKVKARKEAVEAAKLTLGQALSVKAAERRDEIVEALVQRAVDGEMAAQRIVWERLEGKVADRLEVAELSPVDMDAGTLAAWLAASDNDVPSSTDVA